MSFLIDERLYERMQHVAIHLGVSVSTYARMTVECRVIADDTEWEKYAENYPEMSACQMCGHDYPVRSEAVKQSEPPDC